jgi:tRNA nucleotidyltransferase (CCA-adding enzyme)
MTGIEEVLSEAGQRVTPSASERERIEGLAKRMLAKVQAEVQRAGLDAEVRLDGSVAKDTWVSGEADIDIFMRVPASIPREDLGEICLKVARKTVEGYPQRERFAEHPYLEAWVDGIRVNIVPCYKTKKGEWKSSTDRTPFHTDYANERLTDQTRREVRLLKRFMKGVGVYGAEIKTAGFSGYLCEVLTLKYGSFRNVTHSAAEKWTRNSVIDVEGHYRGREDELPRLFDSPLITIDPIDRGRNLTASLSPDRLEEFKLACRCFLLNPSLSFFFPPKRAPYSVEEIGHKMTEHGTSILFMLFESEEVVPDIMWGQLYRTQRSLVNALQQNDFLVVRAAAWSDEKRRHCLVFELESSALAATRRYVGPSLDRIRENRNFLDKHLNSPRRVSGPWIQHGRWAFQEKREFADARSLLQDLALRQGSKAGIGRILEASFKKGLEIFRNEDILGYYSENPEFAAFLSQYLDGRPIWLD